MRNQTTREADRQTLIARLGSMTGFTLSGCLAAWAIIEPDKLAPLGIGAVVTFIIGIVLARRASKTIYGR
ncbi:MAG: hypothetical protein ACMVO5_01670 [Polymorphobacter sp.]|uniref:hypothetical protein n=1 Tax=Polymorphobacter sp. TaxID=1909290 RepID=UPI003A87FCC3